MFDPYNPNDLHMAREYEAELRDYAKDHPHIGVGMSVEVLSPDDNSRPCCEGRVTYVVWSEHFGMHLARVLIDGKEHVIYDTCLRRSKGAIRSVIQGGVQ